MLCFCSSDDDCLVVISSEFLLEIEGVEKALLLNSLMPSLIMLREVSFFIGIVSLSFSIRIDTIKYSLKGEIHIVFSHFLLQIVLTIANSSREEKINIVQTRNQMSINLT